MEVKVRLAHGHEPRNAAPPEAGKGRRWILPWSLQKEPTLRHHDLSPVRDPFWMSAFQNRERISSRHLNKFGEFVTAATGRLYGRRCSDQVWRTGI